MRVFTDGACSHNGRPGAKAGYAVWFPDQPTLAESGRITAGHAQTNQRAIANLPDSDRALLDDRYTHRRSLASIASATGSSERAIEGRLARLRHHLRQSILRNLASRPHEP